VKPFAAAVLTVVTACAYYNAMWRAEQFAKEARRLEASGRPTEAAAAWARARDKAESVLARHPRSRWADDALVLRNEGIAGSGVCRASDTLLEEARKSVTEGALLERATLAAAVCALRSGNPRAVDDLLANVRSSRNAGRRSRAAFLSGEAAWARGEGSGALDWYARSDLPAAALARVRVFLALGRYEEMMGAVDKLARRTATAAAWGDLLAAVAQTAGPDTASQALERLLHRAWLPAAQRAGLLLADGDRLRAAGRMDAAAARYAIVQRLVPDSADGAAAATRLAPAGAAAPTPGPRGPDPDAILGRRNRDRP